MFEDQYDDPYDDDSASFTWDVTTAQVMVAMLAIAALAMFLAGPGVLT